MNDLGTGAVSDPSTLTGQLRRGRGIGLQRALTTADPESTAEIVYDCIRDDPRDDHQTETRTWYLTTIITAMGLSVEPITPSPSSPITATSETSPYCWPR